MSMPPNRFTKKSSSHSTDTVGWYALMEGLAVGRGALGLALAFVDAPVAFFLAVP